MSLLPGQLAISEQLLPTATKRSLQFYRWTVVTSTLSQMAVVSVTKNLHAVMEHSQEGTTRGEPNDLVSMILSFTLHYGVSVGLAGAGARGVWWTHVERVERRCVKRKVERSISPLCQLVPGLFVSCVCESVCWSGLLCLISQKKLTPILILYWFLRMIIGEVRGLLKNQSDWFAILMMFAKKNSDLSKSVERKNVSHREKRTETGHKFKNKRFLTKSCSAPPSTSNTSSSSFKHSCLYNCQWSKEAIHAPQWLLIKPKPVCLAVILKSAPLPPKMTAAAGCLTNSAPLHKLTHIVAPLRPCTGFWQCSVVAWFTWSAYIITVLAEQISISINNSINRLTEPGSSSSRCVLQASLLFQQLIYLYWNLDKQLCPLPLYHHIHYWVSLGFRIST